VAIPVYLPLLLAVVLAVVPSRLARSLPPAVAVWSLVSTAVLSALTWVFSLGLIASTGVERLSTVGRYVHFSARHWRQVDPVSVRAAVVAGAVLAACLVWLAIVLVREVIAAREVRRLGRRLRMDSTVVFVDDVAPHAYAVGGRPPRIVVSRGLMRTLDKDERRAVLEHERAHLRRRHHVHLRVLRLASAVNPLLRGALRTGALAVERWADEDAAGNLGDRTLVARTLVRAALAGAGSSVPAGMLAHSGDGDVGRRVAALLVAPPRLRWSVVAASATLALAATASPVYAADDIGALLSATCATVPIDR
jgi:Zn-dependent protease with chaperone function